VSNLVKGEVGFDAQGRRWTLIYSVNALCRMEDELGEGAMALAATMADPAKVRVGTLRTVFWAGLADNHPELTQDGAGALMTAIGLDTAMQHIAKAFTAAFPAAEGGRPLARAPRPGKRS
jgi:tail tube GTA-gp10-like protein